MDDSAEKVGKLLRQQAAVAGFGSFALRQSDLQNVLNEAARVCADGLGVPFSKVCRYRKAEDDLLIEAGHGWKADGIGVVERADLTSPQGRAFVTGEPPRRLLETAPSRAKNFTMTRTPMFMSAPAAKALTTSGTLVNEGATLIYRANTLDCPPCKFKARRFPRCYGACIVRDVARSLTDTPAFEPSRRERERVEFLLAQVPRWHAERRYPTRSQIAQNTRSHPLSR